MVVLVFASFKQKFKFSDISLLPVNLTPSIFSRTAHACSRSCDRTKLGFFVSSPSRKKKEEKKAPPSQRGLLRRRIMTQPVLLCACQRLPLAKTSHTLHSV